MASDASPATGDPREAIRELGLDDPARYTGPVAEEGMRWSPCAIEEHADTDYERYHHYADRSCDLTMRGGTTSGVIYPLAVCSLAEHYVFRNIGGASAGAIAAAATAAAEHGRLAPQPESRSEGSVGPGFAGLAQLVGWLTGGTGEHRWRLARLFQPGEALHRVFRLATAAMQKPETTGKNRYVAMIVALLMAVTTGARVAVGLLFAVWLAGPMLQHLALPPVRWSEVPWPVGVLLALVALFTAGWIVRVAASRLGGAAAVLLVPLVPWAVGLITTAVVGDPASWQAWAVAVAAGILSWLLLTLAALAAYAVIYTRESWPLLADTGKFGYGLVPGAAPYTPNAVDRFCGIPSAPGVPPLATWLADRIDELAGTPKDADGGFTRALTFGDLWLGPDVDRSDPEQRALLPRLAFNSGERVVNLALMTTDVTGGRPYRMPFAGDGNTPADVQERWQFCRRCLDGIVPSRVITQLSEAGATGSACPRHAEQTLYWLPDPWDVPVILGTRMSLALPGLISAVPLYCKGKLHWFSDGGITSNFPIHFFDALLPRWPTFGLNLDRLDTAVSPEDEVYLAPQDASRMTVGGTRVGGGILSFLTHILDTFLGWRDGMQSAMPGFRGRIANVRQGLGEGGTNLFMTPESIATLALRGHKAGEALKERFTAVGEDAGEAPGFSQTDRYRWLRMRIALREYREVVRQVRSRSPLYRDKPVNYEIPEALADWFEHNGGPWPMPEPYDERITATFDAMTGLAEIQLAEPFDGTSPINPVLRLTPPE